MLFQNRESSFDFLGRAPGVYKLCYKATGSGEWVEQTAPDGRPLELTVVCPDGMWSDGQSCQQCRDCRCYANDRHHV